MDIKESEQRARSHARHLRSAQNEHPLELRLKFAKESEAICQRRVSAAEAEIADLRAELTASDRFHFGFLFLNAHAHLVILHLGIMILTGLVMVILKQ